ncbi:MAG: hypothetical protein HYV96_01275 [Opitutae bacterium]|nr:hypothetical protein [Opitutae bacterium]
MPPVDPRIAIWNTLHDGEITVVRQTNDRVEMFVNVPYIRERIEPLGDSFRISLRGFRSFQLTDADGKVQSSALVDLSRSGIEIFSTESTAMPVKVATTTGYLIFDFDELEIHLDTGERVSYETVFAASSDFWDEWEARANAAKNSH